MSDNVHVIKGDDMVSKYSKATSLDGGRHWLATVNERIMTLRLDQAVARNKKEWFRLEEQLQELYKERREAQKNIDGFEKMTRKFGKVFE